MNIFEEVKKMKKSILIIMMVIISIFTFSATLRVNVVPPTLKNVNGDLLFVTDFNTAGIGAGAELPIISFAYDNDFVSTMGIGVGKYNKDMDIRFVLKAGTYSTKAFGTFGTDGISLGALVGVAGGYFKAGAWISPFKLFLGFEF
jgi:hypothetical protein